MEGLDWSRVADRERVDRQFAWEKEETLGRGRTGGMDGANSGLGNPRVSVFGLGSLILAAFGLGKGQHGTQQAAHLVRAFF